MTDTSSPVVAPVDDDDDTTETTVTDSDELVEADEPEADEPEVDTEPPDWLVIAGLCDCNHVAVSIAHPDYFDTDESIEPVHDDEVVARGADWQALVSPLAVTMAERSGRPISATCSAVYLPSADVLAPTGQEQTADQEQQADVVAPTEQEQAAEHQAAEQKRAAEKQIVDEVHRIVNALPLPSGVRVRGRYDFCGSKHPSRDDTWCRRGTGHDGDHNAYTDSIAVPETWPPVPVPVDLDDDDQDDDDVDDDSPQFWADTTPA